MRIDERMHAMYDMHIGSRGSANEKDAYEMTQQTFSAKEVASQLGLNPKRFRAFVRTLARSDAPIISACGQGNRYGITKQDAAKLIAAYRKAHPSHVMPQAHAPKAPRKPKASVAPVVANEPVTEDNEPV